MRRKAKPFSEKLFSSFKAESGKHDKHLFGLLKRGYIDARYREDYSISEAEPITLIERVEGMQELVGRLCREKIES